MLSYNVERLRRPLAHERPRNDGYPLASWDVAILAVAEHVIRHRHDVDREREMECEYEK